MIYQIEALTVVLLLAFVTLWGIEYKKAGAAVDSVGSSAGEPDADPLSLSATRPVRGFLAVCIVLHHLSGYFPTFSFLKIFTHVGYIVVAVFFFLSGYGVYYGYTHKENYLKVFWPGRIRSVMLPFWIADILAFALNHFGCFALSRSTEQMRPLKDFLWSLIDTNRIIGPGWYILILFAFYGIFWLAFSIGRTEKAKFGWLFGLFVAVLGVTITLRYLNEMQPEGQRMLSVTDVFYRSDFGFLAGVLWCRYRERIDARLAGRYRRAVLLSALAFIGFSLVYIVGGFTTGIVYHLCENVGSLLSALAFCMLFVVLLYRFRIGNPVLRFCGKISYEMHLLHYPCIELLWHIEPLREHPLAFTAAVMILTVPIAIGLNRLNRSLSDLLTGKNKKKAEGR